MLLPTIGNTGGCSQAGSFYGQVQARILDPAVHATRRWLSCVRQNRVRAQAGTEAVVRRTAEETGQGLVTQRMGESSFWIPHPRLRNGCRKLRFNNFLNSKTMDRATIIYIAFVVTVLGIFLISEMIPLIRDKEYREKFMLEERAKAREKAARKRAEYSRLEPNTTYGRYKRMMRGERDWWRWK